MDFEILSDITGMKPMASVRKKSSASVTSIKRHRTRRRTSPKFAVCVDNSHYPASLERHKIYCLLRDDDALREGDFRVIDESGEDYLYPAEWFVPVDLPPRLQARITSAP